MFSSDLGINQVASTPAATDPPFNKVALLLHGDGTNGSQNNTFVDSSTNNFTITRTGNVAQGTFSPFSLADGQWSNYFDGNGDYVSAPNSTAFNILSGGDFTIECWFYANSITSNSGFGSALLDRSDAPGNNGWQLRLLPDNFGLVYPGLAANYQPYTFAANTWYHVVAQRSGTTMYYYINGTRYTPTYTNRTADFGTNVFVGAGANTTTNKAYFSGYISNARIVTGTAVYSGATITVPTAPLTAITNTSLLTCQSNRFKDNSSNNFAITSAGDTKVTPWSPFLPTAAYSASTNGGSGYFDGTSDYLSAGTNTAFAFGTGDFTMEAWVYDSGTTASAAVIVGATNYGTGTNVQIYYSGSAKKFVYYTTPSTNITASVTINANSWNHVAAVRSGTTVTLYVNGVSAGSITDGTNIGSTIAMTIGSAANDAAQSRFLGYITNARLVKGTAVYTANFTPPTAPLTAVTNTQLLLNCTNAGIYDNAGKNDIETVGNAQVSTSVKKYGTGSMYFDGTGDYLTLQPSVVLNGDFTLEFWVYSTGNESDGYTNVFSSIIPNNVQVGYNNSGALIFYAAAWVINSVGTAVTQNAWHHVAFSRSGSTVRGFVDGVLIGSGTLASTTAITIARIGSFISGGYEVNGYLDDVRITQGQALYTSNFTPPTQAFPNV